MTVRIPNYAFFPLCLFLSLANSAFGQIANWQVDPSNMTQYQIPYGWEVNVGQDQGVYLWQALEDPANALGADITVLTMSDFPGSSPAFFLDQLRSTIQGFQLLETKQISGDEYHYKATGQVEGAKMNSNFIFLRDRSTQLIYIASFSAKENDYATFGGTAVLYQSLQRVNPFSSQSGSTIANSGTSTDYRNMQSVENQSRLQAQGATPEKRMLIGEWVQAFSYQTGTVSQNVYSGQFAYGERGYGHLFTFNADNTYSLTYKYNSISQGCAYQADFVEAGSYEIASGQLVLYPNGYQGNYNVCNERSQERNANPPTRYFQLNMDSSGRQLVITGQPLEYSISYETNASGQNYIQEGFNKTR